MENVITLGKLIGLLILFCHPLSILFLKNKRNDLARPVMGTIFLVAWYKRCKRSSVNVLSMISLVHNILHVLRRDRKSLFLSMGF